MCVHDTIVRKYIKLLKRKHHINIQIQILLFENFSYKWGICYEYVCTPVRLSDCRTKDSRLNGSKYRIMFCTILYKHVSSFLRQNLAIPNLGIHLERVR